MCFVAIPASKSHCCLRHDSIHAALPLSPGNPLAQEIMSLYQEPDGTRRLLNYLLDNLAGAIKRSKSLSSANYGFGLPVLMVMGPVGLHVVLSEVCCDVFYA